MRRYGKAWLCLLAVAALARCATTSRGVVPIETRPVGYAAKEEGDELFVVGRSITGNAPTPQMYVKKTDIAIRQTSEANVTGSLYRMGDRRNDMFSMGHVAEVGEFLTIDVDSARGERGPDKVAAESGKDGGTGDAKLDEMMKALPSLEPADTKSEPVKRFKMQVTHRYENGDVLAQFKRESDNGVEKKVIVVNARVPYQRMMAGATVRTSDLSDVRWLETDRKDTIERRSAGWEDEYTMRLSGFDEAKSRVAMELDDKRKALKDARTQMQKQIESLANERRAMAKEREDMLKERQKNQQKIAELDALATSQAAALQVADVGNAKADVAEGADKVAEKAQDTADKVRGGTEKAKEKSGAKKSGGKDPAAKP